LIVQDKKNAHPCSGLRLVEASKHILNQRQLQLHYSYMFEKEHKKYHCRNFQHLVQSLEGHMLHRRH
jgi:hypothetical protein